MAFLNGLKDFASGLTRGFALFFNERNNFVLTASVPGISTCKQD